MPEQLTLGLFEKNEPFNCSFESSVADIGGGKSFCELMGCWTNCREVNHCIAEKVKR